MAVQGTCDPKFQEVRQEFERNFQERGEVGASVCVTVQGQTVVDLWGGQANAGSNTHGRKTRLALFFHPQKAQRPCAPICLLRADSLTLTPL